VVTRYTGDQSLESAQQVVEDAYVHNSDAGATIRLGAFNDQAGAQEMVESLQDQGIAAEVESPE
jgi:cell division septation protein DedD